MDNSSVNWTEKHDSSDSSDSDGSSSKRKRKHEKPRKSKKHKKDKKQRGEDDKRADTVLMPSVVPPNQGTSSNREEWMGTAESTFLFPSVSVNEIRQQSRETKATARAAQAEETAKIYRARELNPHLKEKDVASEKDDKRDSTKNAQPFGDGGVSWLKRSYERLKQQAQDSGVSMEVLAAERWGSLDRLLSLISEADRNAPGVERDTYGRNRKERNDDNRFSGRTGSSGSRPKHSEHSSSDRARAERNQVAFSDKTELSSSRAKRPERPSSDSSSQAKSKFIRPDEEPSKEWKAKDTRYRDLRSAEKGKPERAVDFHTETTAVSTQPVIASLEEPKQSQTSHDVVPPETAEAMSEADLNKLNAQILRAELMGDTESVAKLKAKVVTASARPAASGESKRPEAVMLSRTHAKGFSYPVQNRPEPTGGRGKHPKTASHNVKGERERYFADDEKYSLKDLVSMERMQSADDQNAMFARLASTSKEKTDDDYGVDDALIKKALGKESLDQMSIRDRERAITEHKHVSAAFSSCLYCLEGPKVAKHLVISIGRKAMLMLPPYAPLTEGHCLICPIQHVPSATQVDEDVWEEIQKFRVALCKMFEEQEMECVFMETVSHLKSHPHMKIECIPLDRDNGSLAPMYFKKAIMEAEGEWTQNKKLVDLSRKDIRSSVPKNMEYFAVDFGMQGGYAHVIEDEHKFPSYFGKEVAGGMIDAEPRLWLKNVSQNFNEQMNSVNKFENMWRTHDFTNITE